MTSKDLTELRRLWRKEAASCDRYAACYLDAAGGIQIQESRPLLSEPEERIGKHMALIKKILPMDLENRIMQVNFRMLSEEGESEIPEKLINTRAERLCNLETLENFFEWIRDSLPDCRERVILVYHAVYDIPRIGTDQADQGKSEEVYEHLLCLVCPTKKAKQNLAVEGNKLYLTASDRLICAPEYGFVWPAFDERTENSEAMMIYNADAGDPGHGFFFRLTLKNFRTTEEIRRDMQEIFHDAIQDPEEAERCLLQTAEQLGQLGPEEGLAGKTLEKLLVQAEIPERYIPAIAREYTNKLWPYHPKIYQLMDPAVNLNFVAGKQGDRMRNLLIRAAGVIEDVAGAESELVRELLTAADLQK